MKFSLATAFSWAGILTGALTVVSRLDMALNFDGWLHQLAASWSILLSFLWSAPAYLIGAKPDPVNVLVFTLALIVPYLSIGARTGVPSIGWLNQHPEHLHEIVSKWINSKTSIAPGQKRDLIATIYAFLIISTWSAPLFILFFIVTGPKFIYRFFFFPTMELYAVAFTLLLPLLAGSLIALSVARPAAIGIRIWLMLAVAAAIVAAGLLTNFIV